MRGLWAACAALVGLVLIGLGALGACAGGSLTVTVVIVSPSPSPLPLEPLP